MLNKSGFEMIARILESAYELARFNPNGLPRGYLKAGSAPNQSDHKVCPSDLTAYRTLVIVRRDKDPRLYLASLGAEMEIVGYFAARTLELYVLCAQRNHQGAIDIVAHDFEHLYFWQGPSPQPVAQFRIPYGVEDARFLSWEPVSPVAIVDSNGSVETVAPDGSRTKLYTSHERIRVEDARIWVDPEEQESWYAAVLTKDWELSSGLHGIPTSTKTTNVLWRDPVFQAENNKYATPSPPGFGDVGQDWSWQDLHRDMALGTLDGLSCLIVTSGLSH